MISLRDRRPLCEGCACVFGAIVLYNWTILVSRSHHNGEPARITWRYKLGHCTYMYTLHITSFCWHYVRISIIAITMNTRVPTKDAAIYVYSCVFIVRNVRSIHCSRPLCNVLKSCKHSSLSDTDTQLQLVLWGCLRRRSVLNFPRFERILHPSCAISRESILWVLLWNCNSIKHGALPPPHPLCQ